MIRYHRTIEASSTSAVQRQPLGYSAEMTVFLAISFQSVIQGPTCQALDRKRMPSTSSRVHDLALLEVTSSVTNAVDRVDVACHGWLTSIAAECPWGVSFGHRQVVLKVVANAPTTSAWMFLTLPER